MISFLQFTTGLPTTRSTVGINPSTGADLGQILNYATIGIVSVALTALFIYLLLIAIKAYYKKQNLVPSGKNRLLTYQILVPKFKHEEDLKGVASVQQLHEKIAVAETFYSAFGGLKAQKGFSAWLKGRSDAIALEIVAHNDLISFYITVPKYMQEYIEQQLHAQYPDAQLDLIEDYNLFSPKGVTAGAHLKLQRHYSLPIKTYKKSESDPLNAITNALSKVPSGEGVAIQIVARSANSEWRAVGRKIARNMQKGMSFDEAKKGKKGSWKSLFQSAEKAQKEENESSSRRMTKNEEEMVQGIDEKSSKAGMDVNIRIVASSTSLPGAEADLNQVVQAFSQFNIYEFGNAFKVEVPKSKDKLVRDFIYRQFDENRKMVLNTEEMASLWHLPLPSTETPNIEWLAARTAPAPMGLASSGLHLGYNEFRGKKTEIYLDEEARRRHLYMLGKTGSGKSYVMRYMVNQDIKNGKGVCVIDPHGDLVDAIMGTIPKDRIDDVIYFNPSDTERPMGLNMLEAPDENMRDFAVQEMIAIFQMLFPPEMIGPMFEHHMRNYMLTLMSDLENPGTLTEIPRMIADSKFQAEWIKKVTDPLVKSYWEDEVANTSDHTKSEMMGYLVSKVGRFVENEMMRNIIGQSKSAINFRKAMDESKILLVNLAKGTTGEVNANLLGLIIVSKLQMAAFGRTNIPEDERRDFFLYIDEFQNFITPSISSILSEARKYRLGLILAHQYMGQLVQDGGKTEIRDAVLGNVGSMMVARVGPEDTEILRKIYEPTFSPFDLMNTGKFTWNAKLIANNVQLKPFTLKAVPPEKPNPDLAEKLKQISRLTYGVPKEQAAQDILERAGLGKYNQAPEAVEDKVPFRL